MKKYNDYCKYCNEYIGSIGVSYRSDLCDLCKEFPGKFTDKYLELEGPYFLIFKAVMFFGKKCLEQLNEFEIRIENKFQKIEDLINERLPGRKRDY